MDNSLNNLELAYKKLADLERALILAVDPSVKFKTEHEILELKQQIANLTGFRNLSGLKEKVDISRLPKPSAKLVGRIEELKDLNNALLDKNKNIAYICAAGGIGKSALTFEWLQKMQPDYLGIEKVFAWSFYSQGSHDTQNSSTAFFQEALPFFGFNGEMPKDDTVKGRLLVKYLNNQSFILILDGLEPLQHRVNILDGELKDVGIRAFIDELFYHGLKAEKSLVLISSRQPLKELEQWDQEKYLNLDLKTLNEPDSIQLLKNLGVKGTEKEFKKTFEEIQGHALSLILLGKLLVNEFDGDIQLRDQLPKLWEEEKLGNHTYKILHYYWNLWNDETPEKALLCLLGLFDRPMGLLEKEHLIDNAEIANPLKLLNNLQFKKVEKRLEKAGLLLKNNDDMSRKEWDCHPLIREYVGEQFKNKEPKVIGEFETVIRGKVTTIKKTINLYQQAHLILFEFYQKLPKKHQPDKPEELAPLYRAVVHGCLAGEYKKTLYEVYVGRILRESEYYSLYKLGLYSEDLSAVAAFFPQGWSQPVQQGLSEADQAWLLAAVSLYLMSLGRLAEAIQPRQATVNICVKTNSWENASRDAQNLVDLMLPLGQLNEAVTAAQQALDYAQQSEDLFMQMASHELLGKTLHCLGKLEESQQHFEQAEQLQQQWNSDYQLLFSTGGFSYCALLLDQATNKNEIKMILKRSEYSLEIATEMESLLDISLYQLTLAHAYFKLAELKEAEEYFNQAVDGIRKASQNLFLPMFLLDRANFLIKINKLEEARRDLEEAKQLISRSGMKLYEVDYHLAMCRFFHLTKEKRSFDKHLSAAKTLIKSTGYHLRDKSVSELEKLTF